MFLLLVVNVVGFCSGRGRGTHFSQPLGGKSNNCRITVKPVRLSLVSANSALSPLPYRSVWRTATVRERVGLQVFTRFLTVAVRQSLTGTVRQRINTYSSTTQPDW